MKRMTVVCLAILLLTGPLLFRPARGGNPAARKVPKVTVPPTAFFERFRDRDREAARRFYKKHLDVGRL